MKFEFQLACNSALTKYENEIKGRARYGVRAFADSLLVIPKTLGKIWITDFIFPFSSFANLNLVLHLTILPNRWRASARRKGKKVPL